MMESIKENFRPLDFVIFGGIFVISATVGTLFGYRDRKSKSTDNYYFGGRKISPIPVATSIAVSFISSLTVIGTPGEIYLFGAAFAWWAIAVLASNAIAMIYYIPVFHRLRLNSVFEYLELRFHRRIRTMASTLEIINSIMYLSITVYVPSLALSAVTPLDIYTTIALTSATCTFYTAVGGMKAVIWTDVFQSFIMIAGMLAVFIKGVLAVGGFGNVMSAMERGGRNNLWTFDLDPRIRSSFWTIAFGVGLISCQRTVCNQIFIQRWLSCRTVKSARIAVGLSGVALLFFILVSVGSGLVMYAYYEGCDPLMAGKITKVDQTMPRFAVELFYNIPGMAGLFVSAAFCGTLSTVSSGVNSLAALAMMDFVLPRFTNLTPKKKVIFSKLFTVAFGLLVMFLSYLISLTSSNIIQFANSIAGFMGGPVLGVFTMGLFMPWINHKGAAAGFLVGFACTTWVGLSAILYPNNNSAKLPLTIDNCTNLDDSIFGNSSLLNLNVSTVTDSNSAVSTSKYDEGVSIYNTLYAISPFLYGVLGLLTSILAAHIASVFSGFSRPSQANPELFVPLVGNELLPKSVQQFFRFGVPERAQNDENCVSFTEERNRLGVEIDNVKEDF